MAENCGAKFHAEIASKKFLEALELVVVTPNVDPDVKHRLVELLRNWTQAFQNEPSLWQIASLYNKLEKMRVIPVGKYQNNPIANPRGVVYVPFSFNTSLERVAEDIELAKNNVQLFTQTISFTDPEAEDITKNELIQDLVKAFQLYEDMVERGQIRAAEKISVQSSRNNYYDNYFDADDAGVGGSKSIAIDPFSDFNEVEQIPETSSSSERHDPNQQYSSLVAPLQPTKYHPPSVTDNARQDHMSI
ncbi:4151_t:CDS:2 [Racocetra fulgida]|uniref:4151_t:CDS:1 n=1 Tax=Racocetra fulgida TaxID=60492 RepID=A0A9N9AMG3_9GLOM|nr:4151_t:CDS:2 [Racocetra fulgida]